MGILQIIALLLNITVMFVLLIFTIYNFIKSIESNREIKKYYKSQEKYFCEALKQLNEREEK